MKEPISVAVATEPLRLEFDQPRAKSEHQIVIDHYVETYASTHNGEKPEIKAADGKWVKDQLKRRGLDKTLGVITAWFADPFNASRRPSLRGIDPNVASAAAPMANGQRRRVNAQPSNPAGFDFAIGDDS